MNTLTELNEVESVKIIIDGNNEASFKDNALSLKDVFVKRETST